MRWVDFEMAFLDGFDSPWCHFLHGDEPLASQQRFDDVTGAAAYRNAHGMGKNITQKFFFSKKVDHFLPQLESWHSLNDNQSFLMFIVQQYEYDNALL